MSVYDDVCYSPCAQGSALPKWTLWGLLAAFLLAATSGIFSFGVQDNNEGLYATIAKEMLATGQWVVPHLNGVVYLEKPPLLYWMVAVSLSFFGQNEVAVRLVPAFFMGLTVLGLLRLFVQMGRRDVGTMAAAMLVSAGGFVVMSRSLLFDVPMTSFLIWSLVCFHAYRIKGSRYSLWLFYVCLALAVMAKGLTALVLGGGCAVVATLVMDRSLRSILRIFDPVGIVIFFLIAAPWHILAELRHPGFGYFYFVNEHVLRFLNLRQPQDYYHGAFYYYIVRLPLYLGLWVLFLPLLFWRGKKDSASSSDGSSRSSSRSSRGGSRSSDGSSRRVQPAVDVSRLSFGRWLQPDLRAVSAAEWQGRVLLWVAVLLPLLFFSISRAKANYYWLPSIPALLGLMALAWPAAANGWRGVRWLHWMMAMLLVLALGALIALPVVVHYVTIPAPWGAFVASWRVWLTLCLLAILAVAGVWALRRRCGAQGMFLCICAGGLVPWLAAPRALSLAESELSNRQVAEFLETEPAGLVVFFRDYEYMSSLGFYLNGPVPIVDCHSNDLYYARHLQCYPQIFIDEVALRQKAQGSRVYLVMRNGVRQVAVNEFAGEGFSELRSFRRLTVFANGLPPSVQPATLAVVSVQSQPTVTDAVADAAQYPTVQSVVNNSLNVFE